MPQFVQIKADISYNPKGNIKSRKHYINRDLVTDVIITEYDQDIRVAYYQAIRDEDGAQIEVTTVHDSLEKAMVETNTVMGFSFGGGE